MARNKRGRGNGTRFGGPNPKRQKAADGSAQAADPEAAPPSTDDAKPDVERLNAQLEADDEDELPSDPLTVDTERGPVNDVTSNPAPAQAEQSVGDDVIVPEASPNGLPTVLEPAEDELPAGQPPTAAITATPATRGKKTLAPKFTGRRSQAKREELQKAEEDRRKADAAARAAAEPRSRRDFGGRGRGRGDGFRRGRGRGGYIGQSERERVEEAVASGPFSAGQMLKDARHVRRTPSSGAWGLRPEATPRGERPSSRRAWSSEAKPIKTSDGTAVKTESGSSSTRPSGGRPSGRRGLDRDGDSRMNTEDGGYISSDEDDADGMERMNVEDFGIVDLTQDDATRDYYAPVRVLRVQHKDRSQGFNAEGATNKDGAVAVDANDVPNTLELTERSKSKQRATKDLEVAGSKQLFQAVYSDSEDDFAVKPHIKPDPEPLAPDTTQTLDSPPSSPDPRRKGKERIKSSPAPYAPMAPGLEYETREDLEEHARQQNDLRILRAELGEQATAPETNGDATMTDADRADKRADKVYLFQFPPILPDLIRVPIKADPDGPDQEEDAMLVDPPAPQDNTADKPIKIEGSGTEEKDKKPPPLALPSGAVGQLHVHASGRVTLDWGGTAMNLGMGTEASFLQDVLCVTLPEAKVGEDEAGPSGAGEGTAVSMGQVKGKFVLVPDWGALI